MPDRTGLLTVHWRMLHAESQDTFGLPCLALAHLPISLTRGYQAGVANPAVTMGVSTRATFFRWDIESSSVTHITWTFSGLMPVSVTALLRKVLRLMSCRWAAGVTLPWWADTLQRLHPDLPHFVEFSYSKAVSSDQRTVAFGGHPSGSGSVDAHRTGWYNVWACDLFLF